MSLDSVRKALTGPIPSIHTPFHRDGSIDFKGLAGVVEFCIGGGARTLMLTAGNSHYKCLADEEIMDVTKAVCGQARGRAFIIGADCDCDTARALAFADGFRRMGVDLFMALPCDWAQSATAQSLADHYAAIGKKIPVMIVTGLFIPRGAPFALETIRLTLDSGANVLAIKDDMAGVFAERMCLNEHHRVAIVAGGQKQLHLHLLPFGVDGYLSLWSTLAPEISRRYWAAIQAGDLETARRIVREIDAPVFDHIVRYAGGFDASIHGMMELAGLCGRWRRPPYHSLTDAEMDQLREFLLAKDIRLS